MEHSAFDGVVEQVRTIYSLANRYRQQRDNLLFVGPGRDSNVFVCGDTYQAVDGSPLATTDVPFPTLNAQAPPCSFDLRTLQAGFASGSTAPATNLPATINVRDHGAVGDGVTDDTDAIRAALAAATGGGLNVIPDGLYLVSSTLTLQGGEMAEGAAGCMSVLLCGTE